MGAKAIKGKSMPHNIEAEQCVLGCVLIDENVPASVLGDLSSADFYLETHGIIFDAMLKLYLDRKPIDLVTVSDYLEKMGTLESVGDIEYLAKLTSILPSALNHEYYVDIVRRESLMRKLIGAGQEIISSAYDATSVEPLNYAEKLILDIAEKGERSSLVRVGDTVDEVVKSLQDIQKDKAKLRGITTGFYGLDKITNGLQKGDLILLAARPGFGKTSFAMNVITNAALAGHKCAIFSLEMPKEQITQRMLCSLACVDMARALGGQLESDEWRRMFDAGEKLKELDIYIDDNSYANPLNISAKCRRLKHEKGLDLIMIDYLQLMSSDNMKDSRQEVISGFTRSLKITAKDLGIPILLLSQLNRAVESRKDHTPMLSDLRESGSIEQDADIVFFISRPDQYEDTKTDSNVCELIIAKHRNGQQGKVPLLWKGEYTTFVSVNRDRNEESLEKTAPPEPEKEKKEKKEEEKTDEEKKEQEEELQEFKYNENIGQGLDGIF